MKLQVFAAAAAFVGLASAQNVAVDYDLVQTDPEVWYVENEVITPVTVRIANTEPVAAHVSEVVAVFSVEGKKNRIKPYLNLSIPVTKDIETSQVNIFEVSPVYSLPTKNYLLQYAVKGTIGEGDEAEEFEIVSEKRLAVRVRDPQVSVTSPTFVAGVLVLGVTLAVTVWLALWLSNPGFFESILPQFLHKYLPASTLTQQQVRRKKN